MIRTIRSLAAAATLLIGAAVSAPAQAADWIEVNSPNFTLYTDVSEPAARRYAETLELFDAVLRQRHGLSLKEPARRPLPVYLLRDDDDLQRIRPSMSDNVAGFYSSQLEDTFAVAIEQRRDNSVLFHEYVHHFMLAQSGYTYPGWLIEGYAEYYATTRIDEDSVEIGRPHLDRAGYLGMPWVPYATMLKIRPFQLKNEISIALYYAQSWALTHYMLADPGRQKQLDAYIRGVGAGGDPAESLVAATGMKLPELERTVRTYILGKFQYQKFARGQFAPSAVKVARLPPGAGDIMLLAQRIKSDDGVDSPTNKHDGPVLLNAARRMCTPRLGERLADLTLARAEIKLGDLSTADRLLAGVLARAPEDAEALTLSAVSRLKAAETAPPDLAAKLRAEARTLAGRAYKLDPDHYPTLIAYAQGREGAADYPRDNDLAVLRDALDLAPQVSALRLKTAEALAARERWTEAAAVLRPLATNPHARDGGTVRALLTTFEAKAATGGAGAPAS